MATIRWRSPEGEEMDIPIAEEEPHAPGLLEQAARFAGAVAHHVVSGMPEAPPEVVEARLAICRACPHFDAEKVRCRQCGCRLRWKVEWADASCPLDPPRWAAVSPAPDPAPTPTEAP